MSNQASPAIIDIRPLGMIHYCIMVVEQFRGDALLDCVACHCGGRWRSQQARGTEQQRAPRAARLRGSYQSPASGEYERRGASVTSLSSV
jgi:hypothetical protein